MNPWKVGEGAVKCQVNDKLKTLPINVADEDGRRIQRTAAAVAERAAASQAEMIKGGKLNWYGDSGRARQCKYCWWV